jgi:hypothetical protein
MYQFQLNVSGDEKDKEAIEALLEFVSMLLEDKKTDLGYWVLTTSKGKQSCYGDFPNNEK